MGIYINKEYEYSTDRRGEMTILNVRWDTGYGEEVVETYQLINTIRDRKNCYCCSCGDRPGSDVACRNHGFAAARPCDVHGTPGAAWGDEVCDCDGPTDHVRDGDRLILRIVDHDDNCLYGKMPESIQVANEARRAQYDQ